jgi:anthranilate synthase component 2
MKVLILDNYDSFTYNLYQLAGEILTRPPAEASAKAGAGEPFTLDVKRNNEVSLDEMRERGYDRIIISPGPGDPADAAYFGVCGPVITELGETVPMLGVCLGMQGMAHYLGGAVVRAELPMHGKTSIVEHDGKGVFAGLPQDLEVMRYHSLVVDRERLPPSLVVTAEVKGKKGKGEIMGLRHRAYPMEGIQFHPESFATEGGKRIMENFLFQKHHD